MPKAIPKSLHTVRIITIVAQDIFDNASGDTTAAECVRDALEMFGYRLAPDPHGLAAKAEAQIDTEAKYK